MTIEDICRDARAHEDWQPAVQFNVETPFDTSVIPTAGSVECIIFDYVSSHKTSHKARETFGEFFPFQFGIDIYLFVLHNVRARQSHFLTYDERLQSKGADNIISCLHYYFESFQAESVSRCSHLILFSDFCGGENKNQMVVSYFRWRVQMDWHKKVSRCFLEVGHTRSPPDTAGGLFRMHEQKCDNERHEKMLSVIANSTPESLRNIGVSIPDHAFFNWSSLYSPFYELKGIRKAHVIELEAHEDYRVVTRWREIYNGPWTGVRLARLGGVHSSCLRVQTVDRKWLRDAHANFIFESWPSESPQVSAPPPLTLKPSRVEHNTQREHSTCRSR